MVKYIILGITQGFTEFFPVSSSAHLAIAQKILGINSHQLGISIALHLGTILALVIFFFFDILDLLRNLKLLLLVMIVTVITGIIGLAGKDYFERMFSSTTGVSIQLIMTGLILFFANRFINSARRMNLSMKDAVILGVTQAIAIIPGISRSGITISTLLFRGVERNLAFRFSFLASIPAVCGAALLEFKDIKSAFTAEPTGVAMGFLASFIAGLFSLWALRRMISLAKLDYFGYYCIIVGLVALIFIK